MFRYRMKPKCSGRCRKSGKIKWNTKLDALLALENIEMKDKYNVVLHHSSKESRTYMCPDCRYWHLTSMSLSTYQEIKEREKHPSWKKLLSSVQTKNLNLKS